MKLTKVILTSLFSVFVSSMYIVNKFVPVYMQSDMYLFVFLSNMVLIVVSFLVCYYRVVVKVKPWQKIIVK